MREYNLYVDYIVELIDSRQVVLPPRLIADIVEECSVLLLQFLELLAGFNLPAKLFHPRTVSIYVAEMVGPEVIPIVMLFQWCCHYFSGTVWMGIGVQCDGQSKSSVVLPSGGKSLPGTPLGNIPARLDMALIRVRLTSVERT